MYIKNLYKKQRDKYFFNKRKPYLNALSSHLSDRNISIVSSNCFAGRILQDLNLEYNTPTLGLYFMAPDYIKFLKDIKKNIAAPIEFIGTSKYQLGRDRMDSMKTTYPLGVIGGEIEIHFLHYHSEQEAAQKWRRRCDRINLENLFIIGMQQNLCSPEIISEFDKLEFKNKLFFTTQNYQKQSTIYIPEFKGRAEVGDPYKEGHVFYKYLCDHLKNI